MSIFKCDQANAREWDVSHMPARAEKPQRTHSRQDGLKER